MTDGACWFRSQASRDHTAASGRARYMTVMAFVTIMLVAGGCRPNGDAKSAVGSAPATSPTASATPHVTDSPAPLGPAILRPSDFGDGYAVESETQRVAAEPIMLAGMQCQTWQPAGEASMAHVRAGYDRLFKAPRGHYDGQSVWRFEGDWAVTAMRELRDQLRVCAKVEERDYPDVKVVLARTVLASGFAGADSLIVKDRATRDGLVANVDFYVVVRQGELISVLWLSDQRWTADRLREVGRRLAARLCAATESC